MTTGTRQQTLNRAAGAMLGLLLLSLVVGLLVPVYTDEVAWRFQLSRYFQDGGLDRSMSETCGANTWASPAWFMLPVRMFSSLLTAWLPDPLAVRVAGVALAMLAVAGVAGVVRQQAPASERRSVLEMLVYALLGLGVLPFLLVWSRPDQQILLAVLGSLLLGFARAPGTGAREPAGRIGGIAMLAAIAFSYHMKGLFYLPVFALALAAAGRGCPRFRVRGVALAVMTIAAVSAYRYWTGRFACPDDPATVARTAKESMIPLLLGGGMRGAIDAVPLLLRNMLPTDYVFSTLPNGAYMSGWLPGAPVPSGLLRLWHTATLLGWDIALLLGAALIVLAWRDRWPHRWPLFAALVLAGCATGWAAFQINKNAYESAVYLPVMVLALAFAWAAPARYRPWLATPVWLVAAVSAASQILLIGSYAAPLWAAGRGGGYVAGQPFSLSAFAYPRAAILAAGAKCGIVPHPGLRRVLIDDLTYFAYADSALPMHRLGVLPSWNGSADGLVAWLHAHGSPGAVVACDYLSPDLRRRAVSTGPVCCLATR